MIVTLRHRRANKQATSTPCAQSHEVGGNSWFTTRKNLDAVGLSDAELGLIDAPPEYAAARLTFKDDCLAALQDAFGSASVERHNKCIKVSEKSTTLPADVVPCATLRRYDSASQHHEGIRIVPDRGGEIINWPQQDYDKGVVKNTSTSRRYKRTVRGLKALKILMAAEGNVETPSWLVECLTYNVPGSVFSSSRDVDNALIVLRWLQVELPGTGEWVEVNGLKWLFGDDQPWSREDAQLFVETALKYIASN